MIIYGDFEAHVTVRCPPDSVDDLGRYAAYLGLKFTHIVLARGKLPSQPMLTLRTRSVTGRQALSAAHELARSVAAAGFPVGRVKLEAAPGNHGVPESDADAVALTAEPEKAANPPGGGYFEHHVKLLLPAGFEADTGLVALAVPHAAHLSRNARRFRADGRQERFVTQRCRQVGALTAARRLDALTTALRAAKYEIAMVEREYVVYDSDESFDAGWIDEETAAVTGDGRRTEAGKAA